MSSSKFKSIDLDPGIGDEIAKEIEHVDMQMKKLVAGKLQYSTLVELIASDSGVSERSVMKVMAAMLGLRKKHLKP
jgi:hypothetical protein